MATQWYRIEYTVGITDGHWPTPIELDYSDLAEVLHRAIKIGGVGVQYCDGIEVTILRQPRRSLRQWWHDWRNRKTVTIA